ncbi:MAG: TRL-like family protein [Kiritimatiellales bacterium]
MSKSSVSILSVFVLATMVFSLTGCLVAPFVPPSGMAYSQFDAPLDVDFQNTDLSGMKKGTSETMSILGLVATGDASAQAAAKNGGITKIVHADYEYFNVLGVVQRTTVIVYGK